MITGDDKELFIKTGILIPTKIDENKIYSYINTKERHNASHFSATVLLTEACNLRCTYCFQGHETSPITMDENQAESFIKFVTLAAKNNGSKSVSILLFGGEPLINIEIGLDILSKVKRFCSKNNMSFSSAIITNGTLLTKDTVNKLYELNCQMI